MNTYNSMFKEIINNTQHPSSFHFSLRYATPRQDDVTGRNVELQCKTRFQSCSV